MWWDTELELENSSKTMILLERVLLTPQNSEQHCMPKSYNWQLKSTRNWRTISEIQASHKKLNILSSMKKLKIFSPLRILRNNQQSHCLVLRPHQSLIQNLNWLQPKKMNWINAWKELVLMFATEDCWLNLISRTKTDQTVVLLLRLDSDLSLIIKSYGSQIENSTSSTRDSKPALPMRSTTSNSTTPWDFILGTENEKQCKYEMMKSIE